MVNTSKEQQHRMKNKKKKFNHEGQRTRKVQNFKRKSHKFNTHIQTISDHQIDDSLEQIEMINGIEEANGESLLMKKKKKFYSLNTTTSNNIDPTLYLSDYSTLSNQTFKEILSKINISIDINSENSFREFLDTDENLTFTRQLIQFINKLNYLKLQDEQWSYYYNLGMTEGIWCGRVSKTMGTFNSMCYTYGRRKTLIEQRRKYFKEQLIEITDQLHEHLKQASRFGTNINIDKLITMANDFIYEDQYQLRMEFERRRAMLKFDAKDHQLVEKFYGLKPRQTEIHSAKMIWKAVYDEQIIRYEIAIFKHWFSSKTQSPTSISCTFQDLGLTKLNHIFTYQIFDQQLSSTMKLNNNSMSSSIDEFIRHLTEQTITIAEKMAQRYVDQANEYKQKILNKQPTFKKPPTVEAIITAIENRRINMLQRTQYNIEQTLKLIFKETY